MRKSFSYLIVLLKDQRNELKKLIRLSTLENENIKNESFINLHRILEKKREIIKKLKLQEEEKKSLFVLLRKSFIHPTELSKKLQIAECNGLNREHRTLAQKLEKINKEIINRIQTYTTKSTYIRKKLLLEEQLRNKEIRGFFSNYF